MTSSPGDVPAARRPVWRNPWLWVLAASVAVIAVASVIDKSGSDSPSPDGITTSSDGHLTASEFGNDWPLTVPSADVACHDASAPGYGLVTVTIEGTEYALNGTARSTDRWPDFLTSGYWKKDRDIGYGAKVNISPVMDAGLALCR